jgi:hypothetical protein
LRLITDTITENTPHILYLNRYHLTYSSNGIIYNCHFL